MYVKQIIFRMGFMCYFLIDTGEEKFHTIFMIDVLSTLTILNYRAIKKTNIYFLVTFYKS